MNPLLTIARFEYGYTLRQPTCYLFVALVLGQGGWSGYQQEALFPVSSSSAGTYYLLSSFGAVVAFVTVLLAGQSLTKDNEFKTAPLLYTLPITSRMHFAGRFLGTYATALTLAVFYPMGALFYSIAYAQFVPSLSWEALLDGFIRLLALNCFIIVSITFSLTVFLRSVRGAYVALFLVVLYFMLAESDKTAQSADIWLLLDPFGVAMVRDSIDSMAIDTDLLTFSDLLFINRLLWIGLTLGILAQAENRFSFDTFHPDQAASPRTTGQSANDVLTVPAHPAVQLRFDWRARWQTTLRMASLEFMNLIRQPAFQITTGLLVVLTVMLATVFSINPDFPELPITSRMTALRLPMGVFIGLFLVLMTGELIFAERTTGFWSIYDALPQPNSVLFVAKLLVLAGAAIILTLVLFLTGIGLQLNQGFYAIDWSRYASDLLLDGLMRFGQLIALAALIAVLTNNRLISHLINLFIFLALTLLSQPGAFADSTFLYSFLPGSGRYSDLIGYGSNTPVRPTLHLLWWGMAGLFIVGSILGWNRGLSGSLRSRYRQWASRFSWHYSFVSLALLLLILSCVLQLHARQQRTTATAQTPIRYHKHTALVKSVSGRIIRVRLTYHHPYPIRQLVQATQSAIREGERLFGAYPYASLAIREVPAGSTPIWSKSGQVAISEKQGWTADYHKPDQLDHIDYLVSREVFRQWLVHRVRVPHQPGSSFVCQSLADYLALNVIAKKYGPDRLKQRLLQRKTMYVRHRNRSHKSDVSPLKSTGDHDLDYGRATLALASIGQVWGSEPLSLTIAQFYKQAVQQPDSATATAFAGMLSTTLPDSLRYLTTYLSDQLWFDFKVGRIAALPNGTMVDVFATKWRENRNGQRHYIPINDFVPIAVLDQNGRILHRQLVHTNPDKAEVTLPTLPAARAVLIDPLGAWPEINKHDNSKLF